MPRPSRRARAQSRDPDVERAFEGVAALRRAALAAETEFAAELAAAAPELRDSARNLVHYLAVRRHDVRELQDLLARLGLSSLGRMEAHVLASLDAVLGVLHVLRGEPVPTEIRDAARIGFEGGNALLAQHANAILGRPRRGRATRIMVTMPGEAAEDPELIRELVADGMAVMRINCAHDDPETWSRIAAHLEQAERTTGKRCALSFDLAGPKLRTGPIESGPSVVKWRPRRDALGRVVEPAQVRFVPAAEGTAAEDGSIPVTGDLVSRARSSDVVELVDARERKRGLTIVQANGDAFVCATDTTAYVQPGTKLVLRRKSRIVARAEVGTLPAAERWITLRAGDVLDVVLGEAPGRAAVHGEDGSVLEPAFVSCSLAEVFAGARSGQPILFDDGRIRGVIRDVTPGQLAVEIVAATGGTAKLRAEKGINLPETRLDLPALTARDRADFALVAPRANMIAMSFVQRPEDVDALLGCIIQAGASHLGIVLKIETQAAFERLPLLLLSAMRHPRVAVMVARGDLGVEVGFERLSEVQEEILWLCEAAHVPVIWATQVLESLAKGGMPSRAEVTDAAMGSRAECVMLNKGPYIRETLRFLIDVLGRMEAHQHKKSSRLRKLAVSEARRSRTAHAAKGAG